MVLNPNSVESSRSRGFSVVKNNGTQIDADWVSTSRELILSNDNYVWYWTGNKLPKDVLVSWPNRTKSMRWSAKFGNIYPTIPLLTLDKLLTNSKNTPRLARQTSGAASRRF
jgi:hypothetical protein